MRPEIKEPLVPQTEAEAAAMIRAATGPLSPIGGGNRGARGAGQSLRTTGLTGITLYEPADLTLVVRAGTPLAEVKAALAAEGQMLAFEPPSPSEVGPCFDDLLEEEWPAPAETSTIGGVIAANASGPRRVQAGAARDALIGLRFIDGTGAIVANGGRVMKNVTGYDLVKLMAGSRGTLGLITEVALKTAPVPPASVTLCLPALGAAASIPVLTAALTGPWDVTGAGWLQGAGAALRLEGLPQSVAIRAEALGNRLADFGPVETMEAGAAAALWRGIGVLGAGWGADAMGMMEGALWRVVCRPSQAAQILAPGPHSPRPLALDWGGALLMVGLGGRDVPVLPEGAWAMRMPWGRAPRVPAPDPGVAALEAGLRARFDPRGIFRGEGH